MCWRTPDCKSIYPQQWDMQMFVCETDEVSVNENFTNDEAVEVNWFDIKEILQLNESKEVFLAPPQWYMLKQMEKHENCSTLIHKLQSPLFIQPRLVSSSDYRIWHSILPNDRFYSRTDASIHNLSTDTGPFQRITMKRENDKFYDFVLAED